MFCHCVTDNKFSMVSPGDHLLPLIACADIINSDDSPLHHKDNGSLWFMINYLLSLKLYKFQYFCIKFHISWGQPIILPNSLQARYRHNFHWDLMKMEICPYDHGTTEHMYGHNLNKRGSGPDSASGYNWSEQTVMFPYRIRIKSHKNKTNKTVHVWLVMLLYSLPTWTMKLCYKIINIMDNKMQNKPVWIFSHEIYGQLTSCIKCDCHLERCGILEYILQFHTMFYD